MLVSKLNDRYYLLDFLRGLAAISIVVFHYKIFYSLTTISKNEFFIETQPFYLFFKIIYNYGWIAVQFFFLLSGFIFYEIYLKKINSNLIDFKTFFILRFSRLYPMHLLSLVLILIFFYFLSINKVDNPIFADTKHFFLNLLLIHSWGLEDYSSFNIPSWSISVEILLYIIFYLIAKNNKNIIITVSLFLLSPVIFYFNKLIGYGFFCFFLGGLISLMLRKFDFFNKKFSTVFLVLLFFISLFLSIILQSNTIVQKIILLTLCFPSLIIICILYEKKIYKKNSFSFLGEISYGIYLIHYPIQILLLCILTLIGVKINFNQNWIFIIYLIFLFLFSYLLYKYYELPLKEKIRKYFLSKK